ncbi:MAG: DUF4373 domain-containing protein [Candidatus Gastranaerophilales bacterium]|nr:DUF4373 domain-containing protein [Candidatus Gastranaerophilales bacterium]
MKDSYYFPHFQDARRDLKILRVRKDLGVEGYGIYFMLLEILREQRDFKFPLQDIDLLVEEIGTTRAKIDAVINAYGLFVVEKNEDGSVFFSAKQIAYLLPYIHKKEQAKIANEKSQLARKVKAERQIMRLSYMDSTSRDFDCATFSCADSTSQLKEIKETKETKEIKKQEEENSNELNRLLCEWAKTKSAKKDSPSTYMAYLVKEFLNKNESIQNEFRIWAENKENEKAISLLIGKAIDTSAGEKIILGIENENEQFKITFTDGPFAPLSKSNLLILQKRYKQ